jgi:flagellar assembly protein FliH
MGDVEDYKFRSFTSVLKDADEVESYEFAPLGGAFNKISKPKEKVIKAERAHAKKNSFKISPIVQKHRGIKEQEEIETEQKIVDEVERRVASIQEEAFQKGYDEGVRYGREEVYNQTRAQVEEKLSTLNGMISEVLNDQPRILRNQKKEIYQLVLTLTKWIILRELKGDGRYVERLLDKLITEMQTKANLFVQVRENDFAQMPDVLEVIRKKFGELPNVRVEINHDLESAGMILECDNGIINGSLDEQMKGLEKLFESVLTGER